MFRKIFSAEDSLHSVGKKLVHVIKPFWYSCRGRLFNYILFVVLLQFQSFLDCIKIHASMIEIDNLE